MKNANKLSCVWLLSFLILTSGGGAGAIGVAYATISNKGALDSSAAAFLAKLQPISRWQATFTQTTFSDKTKAAQTTGRIYLSKPGHLRVEIDNPAQFFLINTKSLISYDEDLDQAIIKKIDAESAAQYPIYLLTDEAKAVLISGKLTVKQLNPRVFEVAPKDVQEDYKSARFYFNKSGELSELTIDLSSAQLIEFKFKNHRHPLNFNANIFKFSPKATTEVLEE